MSGQHGAGPFGRLTGLPVDDLVDRADSTAERTPPDEPWPLPGHYGTCAVNRGGSCTCESPRSTAERTPSLDQQRAVVNLLRSLEEHGKPAANDEIVAEDFCWYQEKLASVGFRLAAHPPRRLHGGKLTTDENYGIKEDIC